MSDTIRQMIRKSCGITETVPTSTPGGLGVSQAFRPGASPVEPTWAKSSLPTGERGKTDQPDHTDRARVVGFIPLPQSAVQRRTPNRRR